MQNLYHIAKSLDAEKGRENGVYAPASLLTEGFVHCSYEEQLAAVLKRYFEDAGNLVILEIDPKAIDSPIKVENLVGGIEQYPHIYGRIPWSSVSAVHDIHSNESVGQSASSGGRVVR